MQKYIIIKKATYKRITHTSYYPQWEISKLGVKLDSNDVV